MNTRPLSLLGSAALLALAAAAFAGAPDLDTLPDSSTSAATALPSATSAASGAAAEPDPASRRARAKPLHDRAKSLYVEGRYREALDLLRSAVQIDPSDKDLHYILAFVAEKLLELDLAVEHYRESARLEPAPVEKARLEQVATRVENARLHLAASPRATALAPLDSKGPPAEPPTADYSAWVTGLAVAGGISLLGGGVAGIYAVVKDPNPHESQNKNVDRAHLAAAISGAALTLGGAAGVAAAILALVDAAAAEDPDATEADPATARRGRRPSQVELRPAGLCIRF